MPSQKSNLRLKRYRDKKVETRIRRQDKKKTITTTNNKPNPQKIKLLADLKRARRKIDNLVELLLEDKIDAEHFRSLGISWKDLESIFSITELKKLGFTIEDYFESINPLDQKVQLFKILERFSIEELIASDSFRNFLLRHYSLKTALENKVPFQLLVLTYPIAEFLKWHVPARYLLLYGASKESLLEAGYSQRQIDSALRQILIKKK
jgi:hypothetical protein